MRAWLWLFAAGVSVVQYPAHAIAAPSATPLELTYEAPESCPPASALSNSVTRLVGTSERGSHSLRARVTIERDPRGEFELALVTELDGITGERALHGRSCDSVVDAAAVTLALILNPDIDVSLEATPTQAPAEPAQEPATPSVPNIEPSVVSPARDIGPKRAPIRWLGTSAVGLHFGIMPNPGPEVTLGMGIGYTHWSLLGIGSYAPPETVRLSGSPNAGARLWHASLTGLFCWSPWQVAPRAGACLGAAFTRVQGHGVNVTYARDGSTGWVSPVASLYAEFPVTAHTAFRLSGLVMHPLNRPDAHLDNVGTVQRPSALTANLQAGVIVHVP